MSHMQQLEQFLHLGWSLENGVYANNTKEHAGKLMHLIICNEAASSRADPKKFVQSLS